MSGVLEEPKVAGRQPIRFAAASGVWRLRPVVVLVAGLLVAFAMFVLNLGFGEYPISPVRVAATLVGGGDYADHLIIFELRLPRSLTGRLRRWSGPAVDGTVGRGRVGLGGRDHADDRS